MTEFGEKDGTLVPLLGAEYRLGFRVNTRIISYSLPFYTALHFATQKKDYLGSYVWGLLVLYPLFVFGLLCLCLKELMVNLGADFFHPARCVRARRQRDRDTLPVQRADRADTGTGHPVAMAKQAVAVAALSARQIVS